ncbi:MAG: tetratricopeptide repeat protein [Calothrix sp. CSU_2_0]|nr:tetratricopeptide repeat protein [Calothrix sp. CSU_2_0]
MANLIQILENSGQYESAIKIYDRKLRFQPEDANIWNRRGLMLEKLNRYDEALIAFKEAKRNSEKILKYKPEDADSWFQKGLALTGIRQYKEAIFAYQNVLKIEPDFAPALYNIACCYAQEDNSELAIHNLQKAIILNRELYLRDAKIDSDFDRIREYPSFQALFEAE